MENQSSPSPSQPTAITPMLMANKFKKLPGMTARKFVRNVNEQFVEKLITGTKVTILGTLSYDEYDKEVTKTKSVKIKKAYIDVKAIEIL
jgi:DNA replicative helicase MCM subunit Mcm2 (Cdc46/Mcm family)